MTPPELRKHVRFNFAVNVLDAGFFGFGYLGLASLVTVIPLFLDGLGASKSIIGLAGSLHDIGWQIPQLFTAPFVARLRRYKPMLLWMTINERWPLFGLMLVALALPTLGPAAALVITLLLLAIYGLGGGFSAIPWQSMIGKIMPPERMGTFFGVQSALANLGGAIGAVAAGFLLERIDSPLDFALCFGLGGVALFVSMGTLSLTREPAHEVAPRTTATPRTRQQMATILRRDGNFRWLLLAKVFTACATVGVSFYSLYAVQRFNAPESTLGIMTGVLTLSQMSANLAFGWLGDRWGHRRMYAIGGLMIAFSAALAVLAPSVGWFYLVFALAGAARASFWAVTIALTLEFGTQTEKPVYIGMANTLIAPVTIGAPLLGGSLAEQFGYPPLFIICAVAGVLTALVLFLFVYDPRFHIQNAPEAAPAHGAIGD
jgi:MFS family permease